MRSRRTTVLAGHLARLIPDHASVLDVGTGEGEVVRILMDERPDIRIDGIDVLVRSELFMPVRKVDGEHILREGDSFDIVQFVDVLHHTADALVLLREAKRVARQAIVIMDHDKQGFLAGAGLRIFLTSGLGTVPVQFDLDDS